MKFVETAISFMSLPFLINQGSSAVVGSCLDFALPVWFYKGFGILCLVLGSVSLFLSHRVI